MANENEHAEDCFGSMHLMSYGCTKDELLNASQQRSFMRAMQIPQQAQVLMLTHENPSTFPEWRIRRSLCVAETPPGGPQKRRREGQPQVPAREGEGQERLRHRLGLRFGALDILICGLKHSKSNHISDLTHE